MQIKYFLRKMNVNNYKDHLMSCLNCDETPRMTKINRKNKISLLVLAESIDMVFSAPFDGFICIAEICC